ncbi:hypothetical protein [Campylobacter sp. CCS1377]|uniref:Uncharacterized protein n=1 Tax=Campylobacter sp. CCS1377 TaxID=3158229 RepID=A0AAU7E4S5_9BACT
MKTKLAKEIIAKKLSKDYNLPSDDVLKAYFMEGFYYICAKCEPQILTKTLRENHEVLRSLKNGAMIIVPDEPDFNDENEHLMIDEELSFALINYVCFLITKSEEAKYYKLCNEIINDFIANDGKDKEYVL